MHPCQPNPTHRIPETPWAIYFSTCTTSFLLPFSVLREQQVGTAAGAPIRNPKASTRACAHAPTYRPACRRHQPPQLFVVCGSNPEAVGPDLVVNKLVLTVDSRFSTYALCNIGINGSDDHGLPCATGT